MTIPQSLSADFKAQGFIEVKCLVNDICFQHTNPLHLETFLYHTAIFQNLVLCPLWQWPVPMTMICKHIRISLEGMMLKLKLQYFGHLMRRVDSLEKTLMLGGIGGRRRRGRDEMAGWHHGLDGRESEWTLGDGDGQGGLACCNSQGRKESDTTKRLNWTELNIKQTLIKK